MVNDSPLCDISDETLMERALQGKDEAFGELMKRHKEKAMRIAYLSVGNYEEAKDVAQEAFVKVHANLKKFRGDAKFSTWFYRILMNTAKDFMRKRKWTKFLSWKSEEEMTSFFENQPGPNAGGLASKELGEKISSGIRRLPERQRQIFTLRFLEGMRLREIAETCDLKEGTVKASLHFALEKLQKELAPYQELGGIR